MHFARFRQLNLTFAFCCLLHILATIMMHLVTFDFRQQLKKNIELMVERVRDPDAAIVKTALDCITKEIHTTTSSMTAVPKPLKFLRPHLDTLIATFEGMAAGPNRQLLADVLSLLTSTVAGKEGEREGLRYKLQGNTSDLETWGHEYMRHLAGEIAEEYKVQHEKEQPVDDLLHLVAQIVPYHMTHNAGAKHAERLCLPACASSWGNHAEAKQCRSRTSS
jgi:26S proteasome regulatory subunit N1